MSEFVGGCDGTPAPEQVCGNADSSSSRPTWFYPTDPAQWTVQHAHHRIDTTPILGEHYELALAALIVGLTLVAVLYRLLRTPYADWRRGRRMRLMRDNQRRYVGNPYGR